MRKQSKRDIENYVHWLSAMRTVGRRLLVFAVAVSLILSCNIFWLMRGVGTALSSELICGEEAHTHTEECYETKLICGLEETDEDTESEAHVHTDGCYEKILVCGKEEHTHNSECYAIDNAQPREAASEWEATIPALTGKVNDDMVNVALSQAGYTEASDNYTRYGDWYGNQTGDWNVMFVSFVMNYAGISSKTIPYGAGCWAWQVKLSEAGLLNTDKTEIPEAGDIVLVDSDNDGKADRAGIVVDVADSTLAVIEGDVDGKVDVVTYASADEFFGYVSVAGNKAPQDLPENEPETNPVDDQTGDPENLPEEEGDATVTTLKALSESGIEVTVAVPEGAFEDEVTLKVTDIVDDKVFEQAEEAVAEDRVVKGSIAVDISFIDNDGNEVEPSEGSKIAVSISLPADKKLEGDKYCLFHVKDDGLESISDAKISKTEAVFETESFSIFVITGTGEKDKDAVHANIAIAGIDGNYVVGDTVRNSDKYPYILHPGDTVELIGRVNYPDGQNLRFGFADSGWSDQLEIQTLESIPTMTRAIITAKSQTNGPIILALYRGNNEDQNQKFYIQVVDNPKTEHVVDFDEFDKDKTITVNYGDTIIVKGTPYTADNWFYSNGRSDGQPLLTIQQLQPSPDGTKNARVEIVRYVQNDTEGQCVSIEATNSQGNHVYKNLKVLVSIDNFRTAGSGANNYQDILDHADIEIADGGLYTSVSYDIGDDGGLIKTETIYQSYVSKVNTCSLFDKNRNLIKYCRKTMSTVPGEEWKTGTLTVSDVVGYVTEDYWYDESHFPGDSQFELTSKYVAGPNGQLVFSEKFFLYRDVDSARFDVDIQIVPTQIKKFQKVGNSWVPIPGTTESYDVDYTSKTYNKKVDGVTTASGAPLSEIMEVEDHIIFDLDKRYVIDAYNKCPNHSGLDFTVHQNSASVKFGASKAITNGVLHGDDFTFELVDTDTNDVIQRMNNVNGKIDFGRITYDTPGVHRYLIREVKDTSMENIKFDDHVYEVTVTVSEVVDNGTTYLWATVEEKNDDYSFRFTNNVLLSLPETGGVGILPFAFGGVILVAAAFVLTTMKKRQETN